MDTLGPVQQQVLDAVKEYYKLNHKLVTVCAMVDFTGLKHTTVKKAMEMLAKKQRLRRISPKAGFALLV